MAKDKNKGNNRKADSQSFHWTDVAAENIIREKGDKKEYTVAAGITPSGVVHIGNFREIMTVDLVKRALEKKGKKVRFIYSWDDYDVFRKVPKGMPKEKELENALRKPIVDTPDTYGCHNSYAEHNEKAVEEDVKIVGISPEFIYQHKKYRQGAYTKHIKEALENNEKIKEILNRYREEPLEDSWLPITMFCEKCQKDTLKELKWLGNYDIHYLCECGHEEKFDFKKKPLLKLKWRIDWPMRWAHENVDFEPGGKDHSTVGGSFDTGKQIIKVVWNKEAPTYVMYDFIQVKGGKGKMSSSSGNVVTLKDVTEVYEPEIARYIFSGTRPNKEFSISFDADVITLYEEFDNVERTYYENKDKKLKDLDKDVIKRIVAYELSVIGKIPKFMPYQPGFRHLTTILQIHSLDVDKTIRFLEKELKNENDKMRLKVRAECARNWLEKHAPEEFKFSLQEKSNVKLDVKEKKLFHEIAENLESREWTDKELHEEMYILCQNNQIEPKLFFKTAYNILINKDKGPRLASFILEIGRKKVAELLKKDLRTKKQFNR